MEQSKKWYQSKIILFSIASILIFGSNLVLGFVTGNGVSQEQIDALAQAQPAVSESIQKLQSGSNILEVLGVALPPIIIIFRT